MLQLRGELLGLGYDVPDAVADVAADALETGAEPVGRPRSETPLLQLGHLSAILLQLFLLLRDRLRRFLEPGTSLLILLADLLVLINLICSRTKNIAEDQLPGSSFRKVV